MAERKLIYADDLLKTLDGIWDCNDMVFEPDDHICKSSDCKGCKWRETLDFVKRIVKSSKTVNAVPVVPGHWTTEKCSLMINCSVCNHGVVYDGRSDYRFCPHCGAKMDEQEGEQDD